MRPRSERQIWGWVLRGAEVPPLRWFWQRSLDAATVIVLAKGPRWSRRTLAGRPVGAWLLVLAPGVAILLAAKAWLL